MKRFRSFLPLVVLIAIGLALIFSGALDRFRPQNLAHEQAAMQIQIALHPFIAALIHIGAMTLAIATGIPGMVVLVFAGGMLFGVVTGTLYTMIGVTLGAFLLFLAARHAFGDHTHADAPGLVNRLRGGYLAHPVSYTFFLRLVPFFPFGGVTVALAWLRCPLWLFLAATAVGGTLMTGIETALGAAIAKNIGLQQEINLSLLHDPSVLLPLAGLGLLALVPILVNELRGKAKKK